MRSKSAGGIFQRPAKSGIWWISYYTIAGKRHREKIGRRDEAIQILGQRHREIAEGKFTPPTKAGRTFRDVANLVLEQKRLRLSPQSYETDVRRLEALLPTIGSLALEELTSARLEQVLGDLKRSGLAGATVNRHRSLISSIFAAAIRQDIVSVNPLARVKPFKESAGRLRYLLDDEEKRLRAVVKRDYPEKLPELQLALHTGMRRGEQWSLKWSNVNLAAGSVTVVGKSGRRHIPINSAAREALETLARRRDELVAATGEDPSPFVCPETTAAAKRDWQRWLEKSLKRAGIVDFRWHDLRHTFASRMAMAGADVTSIREVMGHKDLKTTQRYMHLAADHRAEAVEKIVGG